MTSLLARATFDPLRDKTYQDTALGPAIVDFLAWMEVGDRSPRTVDSYERALARGALMFPATGLDELGDGDLLHIARAFSPKQRAKRMAAWKSMFRWAVKSRRVDRNPCDALPDFKPPAKRVYDGFSEEEIAVLCDLPLRDGALMQLLFDAGLRKGEARRLRLSNLRATMDEAHTRIIRVELVILGGKGDKDRTLPATAAVAQRVSELALIEGLERNDHLWYGTMRTPHLERIMRTSTIGEGTFARWWARCLADAGVRYRNPHMTRHTFATRYLRRGGTLERLSIAMGHASIKTTFDLYAHLDTRDLVDEFERVFATATKEA